MPNLISSLAAGASGWMLALTLATAQAQEPPAAAASQPLTLSQKLAVLVYRTDNLYAGREKMVKAIGDMDPKIRAAVCNATTTVLPGDILATMNQYAAELQQREAELTEPERATLAAVLPKLATLKPRQPFC